MTDEHDAVLRFVLDVHAAPLHRYVLRLTGNNATAEDIVQDALFRLWRHPEVLEQGDLPARRWLFTVARNLVADDHRSSRARHEQLTSDLPDVAVRDTTEQALTNWLLEDAIQTLTDEHRLTLIGAYYLGLTTKELAARYGVPEGTIKSRLHYAVRALRLALQERGVTP